MNIGYQLSKVGNKPDMMLNYLKQTVIFGTKYLGPTEHAEYNQVFLVVGEREEADYRANIHTP